MRFLGTEVGNLSRKHRRIAEYLMQNRRNILLLTVEELAEEIGVSTATISRFARAVGYATLRDLRIALHDETTSSPSRKLQDRLNRLESANPIAAILRFERDNLSRTEERLTQSAFDRAVEFLDATQRLFVWADGPSVALIELLRFRLNRFGYSVFGIAASGNEMAEGLVNITTGDVVLVFSFLRANPGALHVVEFATRRGAHTVLCTDLLVAESVDRADTVLHVYRGAMSEFHSLVAPVAIVDALVLGIARRRPQIRTSQLAALEEIRSELPR
ncbi:MAG: MurR/RpiR family transcriptional regulator [Spirochaetota bacterium]